MVWICPVRSPIGPFRATTTYKKPCRKLLSSLVANFHFNFAKDCRNLFSNWRKIPDNEELPFAMAASIQFSLINWRLPLRHPLMLMEFWREQLPAKFKMAFSDAFKRFMVSPVFNATRHLFSPSSAPAPISFRPLCAIHCTPTNKYFSIYIIFLFCLCMLFQFNFR